MKILSVPQIREWDKYTIQNEPISSIDLMERAAIACTDWIKRNIDKSKTIQIYCGPGNNGGDGLAISRLLMSENYKVEAFILRQGQNESPNFILNLNRLVAKNKVREIINEADFPKPDNADVIIDALFGSGLNKPVSGILEKLLQHINQSSGTVIAIDIPTGLFADCSSSGNTVIKASHTLSFQVNKLAFLIAENADYFGQVHILDIGLSKAYYDNIETNYKIIAAKDLKKIFKSRKPFSHKGHYGHALLISGSKGKMGAAVLAAKACLRSGTGLLTVHAPSCGLFPLQSSVPEAMIDCDNNDNYSLELNCSLDNFNALGIGPGMGTNAASAIIIENALKSGKPIVLDADALNLIAINSNLFYLLHPNCIITPHPKEFSRLFGKAANDFEKIQMAVSASAKWKCIIVLKGHKTFIACPDGDGYFNTTGNPGMATAGSGDVLTGIITGLLAQSYSPKEAALLGVYIHGIAGDIASNKFSQEAMIAGDIIACLGEAWKVLY